MTCKSIKRRRLLYAALRYAGSLAAVGSLGSSISSLATEKTIKSIALNLGPLRSPDENGLMLPAGFKSRIIARSGMPVDNTGFIWHGSPDGGSCFSCADGGWVYVSNSEQMQEKGGASAIRFSKSGDIVDAYSILSGTNQNCAGGATPWGTWLSCEELLDTGRVFECDPYGALPAKELPALGYFKHEAVAYDLDNHQLYLTEDLPDGKLYRFTPDNLTPLGFADLSSGKLEALEITNIPGGNIKWHKLGDPAGVHKPTRLQAQESTSFNGGEGIAYHQGKIYFTTKGDDSIHEIDINAQKIETIYSAPKKRPLLSGVDNITINNEGDIVVAEDGGNMQLVALSPNYQLKSIAQVWGHEDSEITGPAFNPGQDRLYFSSQRGAKNLASDGVTYEISGPF